MCLVSEEIWSLALNPTEEACDLVNKMPSCQRTLLREAELSSRFLCFNQWLNNDQLPRAEEVRKRIMFPPISIRPDGTISPHGSAGSCRHVNVHLTSLHALSCWQIRLEAL